MKRTLSRSTKQAIASIYKNLDYTVLGPIYCHEGGDAFWKAKRSLCQRLGITVAEALRQRLKPGGRSLYVGAGVAELPLMAMETVELGRHAEAYNLRGNEVRTINRACSGWSIELFGTDAGNAKGSFDHLWIVSVLNDPERFPQLSSLSYGRADPLRFHPAKFAAERRIARRLADRCLLKLTLPALVTTSTEEVMWIAEWCHRREVPYKVERNRYPTALVGDPVCFIRVGKGKGSGLKGQG